MARGTERTRSTFGPMLLLGLMTAGLTAVASSQTWLHAAGDPEGIVHDVDISGSDGAPLALALSLVALAAWGVVLVSGTLARRIAIAIALAAVLGVLAVVISAWPEADDIARRILEDKGARDTGTVSHQAWYWVAGAGALAQVAVLAKAFADAPTWPGMSSRYDAPSVREAAAEQDAASVASAGPEDDDRAGLELWKALDEGRDPTER